MMRSIGPARLAMLAATAAVLLGFFVFLGMKVTQPKMALLYGNLDLETSGEIVNRLEAQKIPYQIAANGAQVLVPEDRVLRARMQLAEGGLMASGGAGYEIFDKANALSATNFMQNINHLRALEGELARTIRSIDQVSSARVHLVLPKREVFSREQREPSASIVVKTRGGRLDQPQVRAIQNLVASAVPDLKPTRISVVDDRGNLLAGTQEQTDPATATVSRLSDMRRQVEDRLRKNVEALIERSVGVGNVRAEISVDMDFDRVTTNQELFNPDQAVVRSTQTITENNQSQEGQQNVTVANNLPEAQGQGGTQATSTANRTEEMVNYEISKTVRTQVREAGVMRRVSAAVLVNNIIQVDGQGQRSYQARSPEELQQLNTLVRNAIGFDQQRGDTVEVVSMRFAEPGDIPEEIDPASLPVLLGLTKEELFRIGEIAGYVLLGLLAMLLVVRPLIRRVLEASRESEDIPPGMLTPAAPGLPMVVGGAPLAELPAAPDAGMAPPTPGIESMIDIARIEGQVKASSLKKIGEIVDKHPEEAVSIIRNWLYQTT
ncbi:flagellar basal-body MS-ring/collar protein FliF [Ferrovibrio sp.]|uniref:flagellar basal-body MS-ring/collar protein FliF n=1 Tax=Ferrovibrio sp. TaxID=1917215 RepID=UPI00260E8E96|nr:flagellar basal-body MS-ring/collar protein FliF [Ferrovibrio sp.]